MKDSGKTSQNVSKGGVNSSSLRTNFCWTFLGNLIYSGCQWGMLVSLAKIGTPAMVGQFALGFAISAPIILFTNMQLRIVQATDARNEFQFNHYLALRLAASTLALLLIMAILFISDYSFNVILITLFVSLAKFVESVSDIFYGFLQKKERMDLIAKSMALKGGLSLVTLTTFLYFSKSLAWSTLALFITWLIIFMIYDISAIFSVKNNSQKLYESVDCNYSELDTIKPIWSKHNIKKLVVMSIPLSVAGSLDSLNANIPRYFVEHYRGQAELGYFSAIAYLMIAGATIIGAVGNSASPRLARYYIASLDDFKKLMHKMVAIGLVIGITGILVSVYFGTSILTVLYNSDYAKNNAVLIWIMTAGCLWYISGLLESSINAARLFKLQALILTAVVTTTALGCYCLIPKYGLIGAAWSLCFGMAIRLIGSIFCVNFFIRLKQEIYRPS